jgi:PAS domain S-box-containing protein
VRTLDNLPALLTVYLNAPAKSAFCVVRPASVEFAPFRNAAFMSAVLDPYPPDAPAEPRILFMNHALSSSAFLLPPSCNTIQDGHGDNQQLPVRVLLSDSGFADVAGHLLQMRLHQLTHVGPFETTFANGQHAFMDLSVLNWSDVSVMDCPLMLMQVRPVTAAEKKQVSVEQYRKFWDYSPTGANIIDSATGKIVTVNAAFAASLGYEPDELIGTPFIRYVDPADFNKTMDTFINLAPGRNVMRFENHYVRKDGSLALFAWYSVKDPSAGLWFSHVIDDSAIEELRKAQLVAQSFWDGSNECFVVACSSQLIVKRCNGCFVRTLGYMEEEKEAEVVGHSLMDFVAPEDQAETKQKLASMETSVECRYVCRSGDVKWMTWTRTMRDLDSCYYLIGRDVTEIKLREQRISRENDEKISFLAMLGEDLRTPLHAIFSSSQMLALDERVASAAELRELSAQIVDATNEITMMFDNLVAYSLLTRQKLQLVSEVVDVRKLVLRVLDSVGSMVTRLAKRGRVHLIPAVGSRVPRFVVADEKRMAQVLLNILVVLVRHLDGGYIDVMTEFDHESKQLLFYLYAPHVELVAESFRTVSAPMTGPGRWIWLASSLIKFMGGTLSIAVDGTDCISMSIPAALPQGDIAPLSAVSFMMPSIALQPSSTAHADHEAASTASSPLLSGYSSNASSPTSATSPPLNASAAAGSSFAAARSRRQSLPAIPRALGRAGGHEHLGHDSGEAATKPLHVLCAEDNLINRRVLAAMLKRAGLRVGDDFAFTENGQEAVDAYEKAANEGHPFEVVLLDLQMPIMDGYEACRRIRARSTLGTSKAHVPYVVAVTASALEEDRLAAQEAGFDSFLAKPVHLEQLSEVLANVREQQSDVVNALVE